MNRFLRVSFIVGILFVVISVFAGSFTGAMYPLGCYMMLWLGTLVFMLGVIIPKLQKHEEMLRIAGIILSLIGFVFLIILRRPKAFYIIQSVFVLLSFILPSTLKYNTTHRDFAPKFKFTMIVIALLFCVMGIFTGGTEDSFLDTDYTVAAMINSIPVIIISVVMGILLLRGLRAVTGMVDETEFNKKQLRDTLIFFAGCIIVFISGLLNALKWFLELIAEHVINPLFIWVSKMLYQIEQLLKNKNPSFNLKPLSPSESQNGMDITPAPNYETVTNAPGKVEQNSNDLARFLLAVLALAIVSVIIYLIIRKLFKRGRRAVSYGYPNEVCEMVDEPEKKKQRPLSRYNGSPRLKIRFYYAEFLRYVHRRGGKLRRADTCAEVEITASLLDQHLREEVGELTDEYRQARYDLSDEPTNEAAKRAKQLLNSIKKWNG